MGPGSPSVILKGAQRYRRVRYVRWARIAAASIAIHISTDSRDTEAVSSGVARDDALSDSAESIRAVRDTTGNGRDVISDR